MKSSKVKPELPLSKTLVIVLTTIFLVVTANFTFFNQVLNIYPWEMNPGFLISLSVLLGCLIAILLNIFSLLIPVKIVSTIFLLTGASIAYYTDQFGTIIDNSMIQNLLETNISEASDLFNIGFLSRLVISGIVPSIILWAIPVKKSGWLRELRYSIQSIVITLCLGLICVYTYSDQYASFFREHKPVRYYTNPVYPIYSVGKYISELNKAANASEFNTLSTYAKKTIGDIHKELIILVVGETARADHFSLNGYPRNTNPRLAKEERVISYGKIRSCGTSTAISVPCMFSFSGRDDFDRISGRMTENVLDTLAKANVNILWRDNNSDSKGVADRVQFEDFRKKEKNPVCDVECRDTGMLAGMQEYIDNQAGDILIILHSMGSHGPAYFKRYPKDFEKFTPACMTPELSECSNEEIINAYDNTILYTDYFLTKVIELLKTNSPEFETAMFYISDHGESLGEKSLYLHGLPYLIAPDEQTHIPIIAWIGPTSDIDFQETLKLKDKPNSHDAITRILLQAFEIDSDVDKRIKSIPSIIRVKNEN